MSEENGNSTNTTGQKIFLVLAFVAIAFLCYKNYELNKKIEFCNSQIEYYSEINNEFHKNLYATKTGSHSQGTHALSISDVYYQKYFSSNDNEK